MQVLQRARAVRPQGATVAVIVMAAAHAVWTTLLQWDIHNGLGTSSYDVGLYDQGAWLLSRFEAPFVTLMGRNLLGDHASIVMFLVVPLYWIVPGTETLLALQAVVIAAGALPVYFFSRRLLGSGGLGVLMAAAWLLHPAVNGTNLENFHPDSFLGLFLPLALWALLERRWRLYVVAVVLCASVKEDVSLVLVPLGLLVALRGERRRGLLTAAGAVAASLAGMFLLMKPLIGVPTRNAWRIPFGGPGGFLKEIVTDPLNVWRHLTSEERPFYLWQMMAPFGFVFVLAPEIAMVSVLVLAANVVSTFWYQFHVGYHYSLVAVPALLFATAVGLSRVKRDSRPVAAAIVAMCTLVSAYSWTPLPGARNEIPHWPAEHPVAVAARTIIDEVPRDAAISVFHSLAPHMAHRVHVYQFPNPFRVVLYGTDISLEGTRDPRADLIEYVVLPLQMDEQMAKDWAMIAGDFDTVARNEHWGVWKRRGMSP
ncbi:MAG: hypothetical protein RJB57_1445 [Actinomycetota bacterium]|jgi:uncharacterized membrane protein